MPVAKRKRASSKRRTYRRRRFPGRRQYPSSGYGYQFHPRTQQTYDKFGPTYALASPAQKAAREAERYYGRGGYFSGLSKLWGKVPKAAKKEIYKTLGDIGSDLSERFISGRGAYSGRGGYIGALLTKEALKSGATALARQIGRKSGGWMEDVANYTDPVFVGKKLFGTKTYGASPDIIRQSHLTARTRDKQIRDLVSNPKTWTNIFTGRGAYTGGAKNNLFLDSSDSYASEPTFSSAGDETGALTIRHREFITDIYGNSLSGGNPIPFVNQGFELNPGLERTFPWLSQVAQNFDEYSIKQMVFTYKSTIQDVNSANGQVGSIVTATQYNPSRPNFTNKMVMMEYAHAHTTKAVDTNIHGVEADPTKNSGPEGKYVRSGDVPANEDIKTYDLGRFQIAVCGTPTVLADLPIGELWVDYTVELRKPKLYTGTGLGISTFTTRNSQISSTSSANNRQEAPLGHFTSSVNFPVFSQHNNLAAIISKSSGAGTSLQLPDNFAGDIELEITMVIHTALTTGLYDWFRIQPPALIGNIAELEDIDWGAEDVEAGGEDGDLNRPTFFYANPAFAGASNGEVSVTFKGHFRVEPATSGIKNEFDWGSDATQPYVDRRGDIMLWHAAETAVGSWGSVDGVAGNAISGDTYIKECGIQLKEYNSVLAHGDNAILWKDVNDVARLIA